MIKKLFKYFKVVDIDVIIYLMDSQSLTEFPSLNYKIEENRISDNKKQFFIKIGDAIIHESFLFKKLFVLQLINKKGPTIGDCKTSDAFKGKSIYPFVINHIARAEILNHNRKEVFIIVNPNNLSSIKGIEKAGFRIHTKIKAKRFLIFHFKVNKF